MKFLVEECGQSPTHKAAKGRFRTPVKVAPRKSPVKAFLQAKVALHEADAQWVAVVEVPEPPLYQSLASWDEQPLLLRKLK